MKSFKKTNKGFSLIEIIVSIAIVSLVATGVLSGFVQASRINAKTQRLQDAMELAQAVSENFNKRSYDDIIAITGTGVSTVETSLPADKDRGVRTATISGLKATDIFSGISEYQNDGIDFDVEVQLDSSKYATDTAITTTYQQKDKLGKQAAGASGTYDYIASNAFIVPTIKEIQDHFVITSDNYNDTKALERLLADRETEYANIATAGMAPGPAKTAAAMQAITDFRTYFSTTAFPDGKITAEKFGDTAAGLKTYITSRQLKITVTYQVLPASASLFECVVKIGGVYQFPADPNYTGLVAKTYTIDDIATYAFTFNPTGDNLKDVFFYYNPLNVPATLPSGDKVYVNFVNTIPEARLTALVQKPSFYLVSQDVNVGGVSKTVNYTQNATLFVSYTGFSSTGGTEMILKPKAFTNMTYFDSGKYNLVSIGGSGYLTDGGSNAVTMYDMVIIVTYNGEEYARITTTKED